MDLKKYQHLYNKDSFKTAVCSHLMQFLETLHELFFQNHILYLLPITCLVERNCYENELVMVSLGDSITMGIFSLTLVPFHSRRKLKGQPTTSLKMKTIPRNKSIRRHTESLTRRRCARDYCGNYKIPEHRNECKERRDRFIYN